MIVISRHTLLYTFQNNRINNYISATLKSEWVDKKGSCVCVNEQVFHAHLVHPLVVVWQMMATLRCRDPCWSTGCLAAAAPTVPMFLSGAGNSSPGPVWNDDGAIDMTKKWWSTVDILIPLYSCTINTHNLAVLLDRTWRHFEKLLNYLLVWYDKTMPLYVSSLPWRPLHRPIKPCH